VVRRSLNGPPPPDIAQVAATYHTLGETATAGIEEWAAHFKIAATAIGALRVAIEALLVKGELTAREAHLLTLLPPGQPVDLGILVRTLTAEQGPDVVDLAGLIADVLSLFQKNQLMITVERRS
jgi:hypothetical protein